VCARSYSAYKRAHTASSYYDICDTIQCQVFGGSTYYPSPSSGAAPTQLEDSRTDAELNATSGVVRTYNGEPILAEFSSSNGGWSSAGGVPYLRAAPDPYERYSPNPNATWRAGLSASALEDYVRKPRGWLHRLVVTARDGNGDWGGRVTAARLENGTGTSTTSVSVTGLDLRLAGGLRSQWFRFLNAPPGAPASVSAVAGDTSATVSWTPPASSGSSPITSYVVTTIPGGATMSVSASTRSVRIRGLTNGAEHAFEVQAVSAAGTSPRTRSPVVRPMWVPGDLRTVPVTRVYDSRRSGGPVVAGTPRLLRVAGLAGIPTSGPTAAVLNVTAVGPTGSTHLTVWPAGHPQPRTSSANLRAGTNRATTVLSRLGDGGAVAVAVGSGTTHLVVDVSGYLAPSTDATSTGSRLVPVTGRRLFDTRSGGGAPLGGGQERRFQVTGAAGVPTGARAVVLTLTGTAPTTSTYLTAWASGTRPVASSLNLLARQTLANTLVVPLAADGSFRLANAGGSVHAIGDVLGWYVAPTAATATAGRTAPSAGLRVLDTRTTLGGSPGPLALGASRAVQVRGNAAVPATGVSAVLVTVVAVDPAASTYLVAHGGSTLPGVSTVHAGTGDTTANLALVPVASDGTIRITNRGSSTHVVVDVVGWVSS